MGGYRFLDHTTDAVIEAFGSSVEEAFENAAMGLIDTTAEIATIRQIKEVKIKADGNDLQELLFNWLDQLLLVILVDRFLMSRFKVRIVRTNSHYQLEATAF